MTPRRALGRTGIAVSGCTIGTARMTAGDADPAELGRMLADALDRGVDAVEIDAGDCTTADLLGTILRRERAAHRVHVFARVTSLVRFDLPSPHVPVDRAYPGHHIRAETEALLRRLGVERLAIQQLHAWCPEWQDEGDWRETLDRLREEGKIAGAGVSLFDHDVDAALPIVADGAIDAVQMMYNVFDQGAAAALFPLCLEHGVGVIARAPLYFGALAGAVGETVRYAPDDWRAGYFYDEHRRETGMRVAAVARDAEPGEPVSSLALRFSASHPAVSTVAVGMRTRAHLEANLRALRAGALDADRHAMVAAHRWLC